MGRRCASLAALGFLAALACAPLLAQEAGPKYRFTVEAPKELRVMLEQGLQLARWQDDPQMTPELLQRLAEEAVAEATGAVETQGYFSAQVSYSLDRDATPWRLVLHVVPGEQARVGAVDVAITGPAVNDPEAAALLRRVRGEWALRSGMPFTQGAWEEAKRDAVRRLSSWRYAAARIADSAARIEPQASRADLALTLDSGPPFRVGSIEVGGTRRYGENLVRNLSPVRPGDTYDREQLELYVRRLLETGYFAGARVDIAVDAGSADAAPLRTTVIEGSSQRIETGLSFNTDAGLRLELNHRNVDLLDSAWRATSKLSIDSETQEARVDLDSPPRPGATWRNYFVKGKHSTVQNEENSEISFGVSHNWAGAGSPSSLIVSVHNEEQQITGQPTDNRAAVYFGVRRGFRDTDELVLPRRGYFGNVTAGGAPSELATRSFSRFTAAVTLLIPLGRNDDLVLRGESGVVVAPTREGIPSTFLFRTGGDQTIRGYAFESLGVRRGDAIIGGRYLAIGSAELTHWFGPSWGLAAFVDGGNAWDSGDFQPVLGIGGGARFRTPIGPVRLDLAYGEEVKAWRLHFSVGFVF